MLIMMNIEAVEMIIINKIKIKDKYFKGVFYNIRYELNSKFNIFIYKKDVSECFDNYFKDYLLMIRLKNDYYK
jgi:hypothetical protein